MHKILSIFTYYFWTKPVEAWVYHYHLHPLHAVNYSCNSKLVVDEEELKWVTNEQKDSVIITTVP